MSFGVEKQLIRLFLFCLACAGPICAGELSFLSSHVLKSKDPRFGGLSGFHMFNDGLRFLAVSDRGFFVSGRIERQDGLVSGAQDIQIFPILDPDGKKVTEYDVDAEGMAVGQNGEITVSFEVRHRLWKYDTVRSKARRVKPHPEFKNLQNNSSLEALAQKDDHLFTLPERSGAWERPFPVYNIDGKHWRNTLSVPRAGKHLMVGADFGPDGMLYVLERRYTPWIGFSTRVRRFAHEGNAFTNEETLLTTRTGRHDNLEGISVWRDTQGKIRVSMVSDDNYNFFQRTEIVEYVLH